MNHSEILASYKQGLGFQKNDVLRKKRDSNDPTYDVIDNEVVVLEQCTFIPHRYTVVGETTDRDPSRRFAKFEIDGHAWEKIGRA